MPHPSPTPILFGPTASGKSVLALALAAELARHGHQAELITADAFQVYTGMDIGTAKPSAAERALVPHHLIDIQSPYEDSPFTVEDWLSHAHAAITAVRARGHIPIVVGGTSLYIQSLLFGLFEGPAADPVLRAELAALPPEQLRAELVRIDPEAAERIHPADLRRTLRAIEVFRLTGTPITAHQRQWGGSSATGPRPGFALYILDWPKETLNPRINARVKAMRDAGLLDEVRTLCARGPLNRQAREAIGYKQLLHLCQDPTRPWPPRAQLIDDAFEQIKIDTRRFAKNQRTWIRRMITSAGATLLDGGVIPTQHAQVIARSLLSGSDQPTDRT